MAELPRPPLPKPANLDEMNRWFSDLWDRVREGVATDKRQIRDHLMERRAEVMPAMLYNLQQRQNVQQMLVFCSVLGTNGIAALP